jgi:hypothetical protein
VKQHESDQIVKSLFEKNKDVAYLNALDEGHGYRKPLNRIAMFAKIEEFLAKHLGGRYQETMSDETRNQLNQLVVDPSSIELEEVV